MEQTKRKPLRLKSFDYASPGAYFVTVCTKNKEKLLSEIPVGANTLLPRLSHRISAKQIFKCNGNVTFFPCGKKVTKETPKGGPQSIKIGVPLCNPLPKLGSA